MTDTTHSIISFVDAKLASDKRPASVIAAEAGLRQRWLYKYRAGEIPKPGAHMIDRLARYYGFYSASVHEGASEGAAG